MSELPTAASKARDTLAKAAVDESVRPSSLAVEAMATAELGRISDAIVLVEQAVAAQDAHPDVFADAAYLACLVGDLPRAGSLEYRLHRMVASGRAQVGANHLLRVARVMRLMVSGEFDAALAGAGTLHLDAHDELDGVSRATYLVAVASCLAGRDSALTETRKALAASEAQQSWRWEFRARLLEAALRGDGSDRRDG